MTTPHYTTITPADLMMMPVDDVIELANVAGDHLANAEATRIMYALVVRSARITMEHATESANVHGGSYVTYAENAGRTYADVMAHWLGMWPTPTPTPTYTAVGQPVMVQDGPCDVAECNGVEISLDAPDHMSMVDLWVMDFDISSHTHTHYHVTTTHITTGEHKQWLVSRWGVRFGVDAWCATIWADVTPATRATIWAGDMADKLTAAGIDLATLTTPEEVHCAIAQWLVDVDGCNPYDVDGMFVSMMIGLHSPADVAEKTIEDWYTRWVVLNREAIDNGGLDDDTTTTPATVDPTTTNDDDGYIIDDEDFDDAYMTRANAARREYTDNKPFGLRFELWVAVEKMMDDGDTDHDIRLQLRRIIDDCIEAVSDATR